MGKEGGRHFGIRPVIELVRKRLGRVNPVAANVEGPDLTAEEMRRALYARSSRLYRKSDLDDAINLTPDQRIPFGDIAEHRKRRGLR